MAVEILMTVLISAGVTVSALASRQNWALALVKRSPLITAGVIALVVSMLVLNNAAQTLAIAAVFTVLGTYIGYHLLLRGEPRTSAGKSVAKSH